MWGLGQWKMIECGLRDAEDFPAGPVRDIAVSYCDEPGDPVDTLILEVVP